MLDRALFLLTGLSLAIFVAVPPAFGHEIPSDVTVRIIVRPVGEQLNVLVRAPLEAMQDIAFPVTEDGFLDVPRADATLRNAATLWLGNDIQLFADGEALGRPVLRAVRATIPSDRSFTDFESARALMESPRIRAGTQLVWQQALIDAWFSVPIASAESAFAILPDLDRLGLAVAVAIRFESAAGDVRAYQIEGEAETIDLDPSWFGSAVRFVVQGFWHILGGIDHLLFLLCLVLPFRQEFRSLVLIVTAFTVAHSITLIGSAFGLAPAALWFTPLVETLIALSILYMAVENVLHPKLKPRWVLAFGFGLIHGFGFSFALRNTLQFAGDNVLTSLFAFNVGVELGQLAVLCVLVPFLLVLFRYVPARAGVIVISVLVGHTAWHWMTERYQQFREYPIVWTGAATINNVSSRGA
jgi:hypothetical protein